jgi:hypothetical protein
VPRARLGPVLQRRCSAIAARRGHRARHGAHLTAARRSTPVAVGHGIARRTVWIWPGPV